MFFEEHSLLTFLVTALAIRAEGFNLDLNNSITFTGPIDDADAFFGISISLFESHCFIGAPGDNRGRGSVYLCFFSPEDVGHTESFCHPLNEETSGLTNFEAANLGASMAQDDSNAFVCAPLTRREKYHSIQANMGSCYRATAVGIRHIFTLKSVSTKLWKTNTFKGWRTTSIMGQALSMTSEGELVVGLPLARSQDFSWDTERVTGGFGVVRQSGRKNFMLPKPSNAPWSSPTHATIDDPHGRDLGGTAIAKGKFFSAPGNHYAVGSPKSNLLKGRVSVCKDCFDESTNSRLPFDEERLILEGDQIGAKFGQTVIAVNLDGDMYDDIVVGAPLHSQDENHWETGEVYIYKTVGFAFAPEFRKMTSIKLKRKIQSRSQFGASLGRLGDLDGDGFEDFAVGAPFEDNGAVYIYRGNSIFQIQEYSQKIYPELLNNPNMRGFGYSISRPYDVDNNQRPDVIFGAVSSNHAVLLRALPVMRLHPVSAFKGTKLIEPSKNAFSVLLCVTLTKATRYPLTAKISYPEIDERIRYPIEGINEIMIPELQAISCVSVNVTSAIKDFGMDKENITEIPKPLKLRANIQWDFFEDLNCQSLSCPVFDPLSKRKEFGVSYDIELKSVCQNRTCECQLDLWSVSSLEYVVGEAQNLTVSFNLRNIGKEPAFNIKMLIAAEDTLLKLGDEETRRCQEEQLVKDQKSGKYECNLGYLKTTSSQEYSINFDVSDPKYYPKGRFTFAISIHSSCALRPVNSFRSIAVDVKHIYDISVKNHVEEKDQDFDQNSVKGFTHSYMVHNAGPSPTDKEITFVVGVPVSSILDNLKTELVFDNSKVVCDARRTGPSFVPTPSDYEPVPNSVRIACDSEAVCLKYHCTIRPRIPTGFLNIFLRMTFKIDQDKRDYTESYEVLTFLNIPSFDKFSTASTNFDSLHRAQIKYLYEFVLPLGGGLLIGVILLIILFIILWKTGAFSKMRIYKKKLQEAEREKQLYTSSASNNDRDYY